MKKLGYLCTLVASILNRGPKEIHQQYHHLVSSLYLSISSNVHGGSCLAVTPAYSIPLLIANYLPPSRLGEKRGKKRWNTPAHITVPMYASCSAGAAKGLWHLHLWAFCRIRNAYLARPLLNRTRMDGRAPQLN